ncbi:DUF3854 domain-containing protein, partial [Nostoc sp.]
EGAKKAASLLSQGHAAIGLPGISAGYRSPKDEFGKKIGKSYLHEELAVFATPNREIKFCFDYETKPETKLNIERDISVTGGLLQKAGAKVKVVSLPGPDKGVDDFIVARGPLAYEKLSHQAMNLRDWQRRNQYKSAATISPPQKLTPEQRSLQQNQSIGQTDDINRQQPKTDTGISSVNRENREIVEQSRETESGIERKNPTFGTEPSRRNEEFLTAISRDIELQEVEQLGDDIEGINHSVRGSRGTTHRTEGISRDTDRKNSAILDQTTSYRSSERIVNAITNFVEQSSVEVALAETLQPLIQEISHYQQELVKGAATFNQFSSALAEKEKLDISQKAINAIADYTDQSSLESALVEILPSVINKLSQYQQDLADDAATLDQLSSALDQKEKQQISQKAVDAIVKYVEQSSVESMLIEALSPVFKEISQYQQNLAQDTTTIEQLTLALIPEQKRQLSQKALNAIADYIEQSSIEFTLVKLPTFINKLSESQSNAKLTNTIKKLNPVFDKLNTLQREAAQKEKPIIDLRLLLQQKIQSLEKLELKYLFWEMVRYAQGEEFEGKEVNKLFSSVGKPDFPLNFQQRMDLVRLLVREDVKQISKRLDPEQDNRQQRGFRR